MLCRIDAASRGANQDAGSSGSSDRMPHTSPATVGSIMPFRMAPRVRSAHLGNRCSQAPTPIWCAQYGSLANHTASTTPRKARDHHHSQCVGGLTRDSSRFWSKVASTTMVICSRVIACRSSELLRNFMMTTDCTFSA
eukprot:3394220-Rhodomonas_salina.2